ncbi:malonyl-CoA O-methyltransferase [Candidatus Termititenax persephonae]|uniref:Malonyl-CoA O-methyltransferase n=1 Tax=Candidatus Termititenax persephonae TaxID=2218525 RepID=A0A388TEL5_9BACT|nr:malonyl-CoA O-methyltransferase [Candidatus Termititenax persephonae]
MTLDYNMVYKKQCETSHKKKIFCPLRYERQMDYLFGLLRKDFRGRTDLRVLDACCGYGRLVYFLNKFNSLQSYTGLDYSAVLINEARKMFKQYSNINFKTGNIFRLSEKYSKYFDYTINYKTLSWLPYYEQCVRGLMKATKNKIYLTSLFNDGDYDSICKVYSQASRTTDFTYLNTYSLPKFRHFCLINEAKQVRATSMKLSIDLKKPRDKNKIMTYTQRLATGYNLEITGNTLLNWKLIEIVL